MEFLRGNSEYA
jgi:hypothetical protein